MKGNRMNPQLLERALMHAREDKKNVSVISFGIAGVAELFNFNFKQMREEGNEVILHELKLEWFDSESVFHISVSVIDYAGRENWSDMSYNTQDILFITTLMTYDKDEKEYGSVHGRS